MATAYFQPITRGDSKVFGREVSRNTISSLRGANFLASGPRSPTPSAFGMETLRDLPDIEALEDAGLLSRREMASYVDTGLATDIEDSVQEG